MSIQYNTTNENQNLDKYLIYSNTYITTHSILQNMLMQNRELEIEMILIGVYLSLSLQ